MSEVMFSVIMPSYLGEYKRAASNRLLKFYRAVQSVIKQDFDSWELIIISDGCEITSRAYNETLKDDHRIKLIEISKQPTWSGEPRNAGIREAVGKWIIYLDTDDIYLPDYLSSINDSIGDMDWYWVNDLWQKNGGWEERQCDITRFGQCGTSNMIHKSRVQWKQKPDYGHDWIVISALRKESEKHDFLPCCGYVVMHVPNKYDL